MMVESAFFACRSVDAVLENISTAGQEMVLNVDDVKRNELCAPVVIFAICELDWVFGDISNLMLVTDRRQTNHKHVSSEKFKAIHPSNIANARGHSIPLPFCQEGLANVDKLPR